MPRRLPPLNALRAFEATARCGSFTRRRLLPALPQHVHDFESWIVAEAQAAEA